jgi:hypothetical protein
MHDRILIKLRKLSTNFLHQTTRATITSMWACGAAFGLNKRGRGIYDWNILEREHRAFMFLSSSTMDNY